MAGLTKSLSGYNAYNPKPVAQLARTIPPPVTARPSGSATQQASASRIASSGGGAPALGSSNIAGGGPTPWWQTSQGAGDRVGNLQRSAPSGYEYDPVRMAYVQKVSSAPTQERLQNRQLSQEDQLFSQQEQLFNQQLQARNAAISGLQGLRGFGSMGGFGGGGMPTGTTSTVNYPRVSMGAIPDASGAQNAAFGSAKAQAGAMGRSALDSLRSELAERNMLGGGTEARGLVDRLAAATNPLSDLNVAQEQEKLGIAQHSQDLAAQMGAQQYAGGITQRGQDIGVQESAADRAQRERLTQLQLLQQALSGLVRSY